MDRFTFRNGRRVTAVSAIERVRRGALLLDVRHGGEWREGHAATAIHIPLDELQDRMGSLPVQRPVVVLCRNGARSRTAARMMARQGYDVCSVRGGLAAWAAAGGPVTAGRPIDAAAIAVEVARH